MQTDLTDKTAKIVELERRLAELESDGRDDLDAKLNEMSHLLELEKLERANIEAELGSIKQQRDTWNAYFERRKEEEEEGESMVTETAPMKPANTRKSPRKAAIDNKEHMRLMVVEEQFKERVKHCLYLSLLITPVTRYPGILSNRKALRKITGKFFKSFFHRKGFCGKIECPKKFFKAFHFFGGNKYRTKIA